MTGRIFITGSAGYLGSKVVDILAAKGGYEIYGIDVRRPKNEGRYAKFFEGSVTDVRLVQEAFDEAKPDIAIHLAFVVTTTHDKRLEESVAITGSQNFLDNCARLNVGKIVFLTSVAAYGAHDDNDVPLTESSPIRGVEGYGYSRLKAVCDRMATEYMKERGECRFVILRPCLFLGPNTKNNFFDVLNYPIVPMVKDKNGVRDPLYQFIGEDDMAACVVAAAEKDVSGIFNVAGDGTERFSKLVRRFGKRSIAVPSWLLYPATSLLWKLHLVTSPPAMLDFIRYDWVMDASKMRRELFTPTKTTLQAFDEYAAANHRTAK